MQLAERDGFIGAVLIEGLSSIFVPRFLWPEKPSYMPGAWFTWYLGGQRLGSCRHLNGDVDANRALLELLAYPVLSTLA